MNLRCKVCGARAAGFHFGAFTCEGCKSFFGRCCNNMSIIGECRNNKECIIDKKNRTSCKACRLRKCLKVGMSKNGSRYGRRSNWFKQFFQDTEQSTDLTKMSKNVVEPKTVSQNEKRNSKGPSAHHSQSSLSSHFYVSSYLPHISLNRLISYSQNAKLFFYHRDLPLNMLNSEICDNVGSGKFLYRDDDHSVNDPLDLSKKSSTNGGSSSNGAKKNLPLDLSVK